MKHFWKKTLWAALLTAAFALSATGCGNDSQTSSSTANSADSAAQTEESSAAPAENGGAADAAESAEAGAAPLQNKNIAASGIHEMRIPLRGGGGKE